ncbi:hypothetical protein ACWDSJ_32280 [Nocardia sp. NPDC003482]
MSMEIMLLLVCVAATFLLWWAIAACLERRVRPTAWWRDRKARPRVAARPVIDDGPPAVLDHDLTVEWADPAQVWPALNAENALLAARISGQITPIEYRARVADLARRCEPHSAADSE